MENARAVSRLVGQVLADVEYRRAHYPEKAIKARCADAPPSRDVIAALRRPGCSVIPEIKRTSPGAPYYLPGTSIGEVARMARAFEAGGAHLIACQTERLRFDGSLADMAAARGAVDIPLFCRDLILSLYQVYESRVHGADLVPLRVGLLDRATLAVLFDRIDDLGMTAVAEVRSPEEADIALREGAKVIAVNARPLTGGTVEYSLFAEIIPFLPSTVAAIAMSGVRTSRQLLNYAAAGADAVVIGRELMGSEDPVALTRRLVAVGQHPSCPSR